MRVIIGLMCLLVLAGPHPASGQPFVLQGSAGPTLVDTGHSVAAGVGLSPSSHVTILFNLERTHLSSQLQTDGRGSVAGFRGGTMTLGAGELRVALFGRDRVAPYGLAGFAAGVSRPNVNDLFPERVANDVRAVFFGGGINVPVTERIGIFVDGRMMIGEEAGELLAVAPIRAGIGWRF